MRLRSIIVDDEETGIETLKLLLEKHAGEVKVVAQATRARDAIILIENYTPDIVFLDISMPEMDGFELLEQVGWRNFSLVFTTAYHEHGLRALKLNALDYLLKPIDHRDLQFTIDKIKRQRAERLADQQKLAYSSLDLLPQNYPQKVGVNSKNGVEYVDVSEIICLESKSNYTLIHLTSSGRILTPKTLKEFDQQLCNNLNFMRVHHSFAINLHKVLKYLKEEDTVVMTDGQKIPLSKSRRAVFFKWLEM